MCVRSCCWRMRSVRDCLKSETSSARSWRSSPPVCSRSVPPPTHLSVSFFPVFFPSPHCGQSQEPPNTQAQKEVTNHRAAVWTGVECKIQTAVWTSTLSTCCLLDLCSHHVTQHLCVNIKYVVDRSSVWTSSLDSWWGTSDIGVEAKCCCLSCLQRERRWNLVGSQLFNVEREMPTSLLANYFWFITPKFVFCPINVLPKHPQITQISVCPASSG